MAKYPQLNIRVDDKILEAIDDWRRTQKDIPSRPEAARRLFAVGLALEPIAQELLTYLEWSCGDSPEAERLARAVEAALTP